MISTARLTRVSPRAQRFRCLGACCVRVLVSWREEVGGLTYDLACGGVGFVLLQQLPEGTQVLVERVGGDGARPILATVVRSERLVNGWFHGCQLAAPLSEADLAVWLR
jgi:hypothetical protein